MTGPRQGPSRAAGLLLSAGVLVVLLAVLLWWWDASSEREPAAPQTVPTSTQTPGAQDPGTQNPGSTDAGEVPTCDLEELPATVLPVIEDIETNGPFDHPGHDGGRFGNYEGVLPDEALGYYREYTVQTPGLNHRGPRRIVTGGEHAPEPQVWYYTDDHYDSFCEFALP